MSIKQKMNEAATVRSIMATHPSLDISAQNGSAIVIEDGQLIGIVTTIDICRYVAERG